jgi:hypothetical protein
MPSNESFFCPNTCILFIRFILSFLSFVRITWFALVFKHFCGCVMRFACYGRLKPFISSKPRCLFNYKTRVGDVVTYNNQNVTSVV